MSKLGMTALIALGLLLFGHCSGQATEKITLIVPLPQLTSVFAFASSIPSELGFYKEEGLEVEALPSPGAVAGIQLVIGGRATAAMSNPGGPMIAVQKGSPIKFYYSAQQGDIFGIGPPEGSGLNTLADLKGKSIGVMSFASGGTIYARGLLSQAGLTDKDYSLVEIGVGGRAAAAIQSGQVQALSLFEEAYAQLQQGGVRMSKIIRDPRASEYISGCIVVLSEDLERRKDMFIGLARAMAKGQAFQEANPEASVRIHWKVYPHTAPRAGVNDEDVRKTVEINRSSDKFLSRNALGTNRYGDAPRKDMEKLQRYLVETGVVPKEIDVSSYYTNDLIDRINAFDTNAIVTLAKSYTSK
jgi:NitT/TauT family transport system substrate-binding protein